MEFTAADIKVLDVDEHVRLRPTMYVGSIGRGGCVHLSGIALSLLAGLAAHQCTREDTYSFSQRTFLDVTLKSRGMQLGLYFGEEDTPDIINRSIVLADKLLNWKENGMFEMEVCILSALTEGLVFQGQVDNVALPFDVQGVTRPALPKGALQKGRYVSAGFDILPILDPTDISKDYLEGFFDAQCRNWPGLELRDVSVVP